MKVGFTGTRQDMTCEQHRALCKWILDLDRKPAEFHHGCCIGADSEAHDAMQAHSPQTVRHAHPPEKGGLVSASAFSLSNVRHERRPYLDRNRDIVDACDVLLACPKGPEELRSGTWSTVRYARKVGKPVVIFWPDGTVEG